MAHDGLVIGLAPVKETYDLGMVMFSAIQALRNAAISRLFLSNIIM
jgi:hypothetical protein